MQERVDLVRFDAHECLITRDQLFVGLVDGDAYRRLGGALAVAGLEHPELAPLDGELHVLHVAVVLFEGAGVPGELLVTLGHLGGQLGDGTRGADARDHVLTLGIDEEVALDGRLTGGGVTRHGDAGGRVVSHVAEHHGLDVHRSAEVVVDAGGIAVVDGALAVPRAEDRLDGVAQLGHGVVRERLARLALDDDAELTGCGLQVGRAQLGVGCRMCPFPETGQRRLEKRVVDAEHDRAEHLHESPLSVVHEVRIAGELDEAGDDVFVQADVEHRVHHPGHGELGAAATRQQQRTIGAPEGLAGGRFDLADGVEHLVPEPVGEPPTTVEVGNTGFGCDGEAGRHGYPEPGHLAEVGALAPEQGAGLVPTAADGGLGIGNLVEQIDPGFR